MLLLGRAESKWHRTGVGRLSGSRLGELLLSATVENVRFVVQKRTSTYTISILFLKEAKNSIPKTLLRYVPNIIT